MHSLSEFYDRVVSGEWTGSIQFTNEQEAYDANRMGPELKLISKQYIDLGLEHSDKVILRVDNTIESILSFVALWNMGVVVIPVKKGINIDGISEDSKAKFLIAPEINQITKLEDWVASEPRFNINSKRVVTGVDLALIIYTSGSTGVAKGIMLSHGNVISALESIVSYLGLDDKDRILCTLPLSFDYGLYQLLFCLYSNLTLVVYRGMMQPVKLIKTLKSFRVTIFPVVPATAVILEKGLSVVTEGLPDLRMITNTGGHLMQRCIQEYLSRLPHTSIIPMYGLTESKRALYLPPDKTSTKVGSVGVPMPGIEAKLFRENKGGKKTCYQEVDKGHVGELFLRGASVMQGYVSNMGSGSVIHNGLYRDDNWISTGDLFIQDSDGYYYFSGRNKDLIKQAGFCLYPHELEEVIQKSPLVDLVVVVLDYDRLEQEIAHAIINITSQDKKSEFEMWLTESIDRDYKPNKISYVDQFIFTENGKPDKKSLLNAVKEKC